MYKNLTKGKVLTLIGHRKVTLLGIGMGTEETLTVEGKTAIEQSDLLIGAKRMLEPFKKLKKDTYVSYVPKEIGEFLKENKQYRNVAILLSGDVGFYSGAKKILEELKGFQVEVLPGISSLIYFCAKLKIPWEDVCFTSLHGKKSNIILRVKREEKTFALLDGTNGLKKLCEKLGYYGLGEVVLHIGENLSYPEEKIYHIKAKDLKEHSFDNLLVVLIENPTPIIRWGQIRDEEFIRGEVPMTKSEVRTVSISKLQLKRNAIVYDVGAGTGSVSIEIALQSPDMDVYAIEKKEQAIELVKKNVQKFGTDNVCIVEGDALQVLEGLPAPTHVFIGGSSGRLKELMAFIWEKSPEARVVINTVSLNTIAEVMEVLEHISIEDVDITQMNVSKGRKLGNYQMMMGQNPIYIVALEKKNK